MEASLLQTTTPALPASQFHQKLNISLIQLKNPKQPKEQETTPQALPSGEPQQIHSADSEPCALSASPSELSFWKSLLWCDRATLTAQTHTKASAGASKDLQNTPWHSPSRRRGRAARHRSRVRAGEPVGQRGPTRGVRG